MKTQNSKRARKTTRLMICSHSTLSLSLLWIEAKVEDEWEASAMEAEEL